MEDRAAVELLNSLRTTAFSSNGRRELLDGLDLIEWTSPVPVDKRLSLSQTIGGREYG